MSARRATSEEDIDAAFGPNPARTKTADKLLDITSQAANFEVFEDTTGVAYMRGTSLRGNALATWRLHSMQTRHWLYQNYQTQYETTPGRAAVDEAIAALAAKAAQTPRQRVHLRVGKDPLTRNCYIDLGTDDWCVVALRAATGTWELIRPEDCPLVFRRTNAMKALPLPDPDYGDGVDLLKRVVNLSGEDNFEKFVAFLLAAIHGSGPYPGGAIIAKKGSGKSNYLACAVRLVDPNEVAKNIPPRRDADLMTTAHNRHLLAFDNITYLTSEVQDLLSVLSTGGGKQDRAFHQQDDVHTINATRPWLTTGIDDYITKSDTLRRTLLITPPPITEYIDEETLDPLIEAYAPKILGHLYTALASALKAIHDGNVPKTQTTSLADLERLIGAAEPALGWEHGTFTRILASNATSAAESVIETVSPIVDYLATLPDGWSGTAGELHSRMATYYDNRPAIAAALPRNPRALSVTLVNLIDELAATKRWLLYRQGQRIWVLDKTITPPTNAPTEEPAPDADDETEEEVPWYVKH